MQCSVLVEVHLGGHRDSAVPWYEPGGQSRHWVKPRLGAYLPREARRHVGARTHTHTHSQSKSCLLGEHPPHPKHTISFTYPIMTPMPMTRLPICRKVGRKYMLQLTSKATLTSRETRCRTKTLLWHIVGKARCESRRNAVAVFNALAPLT
eukprot:5443714-Amphidinium_carterae.1